MENEELNRAKSLLIHYMKNAYEAAGLSWNSDNDVEIGEIVEIIATVGTATALEEIPRRFAVSDGYIKSRV